MFNFIFHRTIHHLSNQIIKRGEKWGEHVSARGHVSSHKILNPDKTVVQILCSLLHNTNS